MQPARRFLAAMRHTGLVEMDFIRNARDNRYYLLDVNPRPWTWIGLAEAAGVDLALAQWRLSRGEPAAGGRGKAGAAV